jgi:NAD(P)-dependent dehydrogenase (short-subunit alcohol dehydrogenase family)
MGQSDRVAVVTGGSSGIGRGIALVLAGEGISVAIGDVRSEPAQGKYYDTDVTVPTHEKVRRDGGEAIFQRTDVSDPDQCERLIERTVDEFGQLDVLVNNAGIHIPGNAEELSIEDWQTVLETNLSGQFYCAKHAISHLRRTAGTIVNIGSVHAVDGGAGPPYTAAKAGVVNLTKDLATAFGEDNINVNAVCPGYIETPIQDYLTQDQIDAAAEHTSLPRFGTPEDVAHAVSFLASEKAAWITGEALFVDGGWTAHR